METLITNGIFLVEKAPNRDCIVEFLHLVGATYSATHYGGSNWHIRSNPDSKDLPTSGKKLELHIDMPYLTKPCQVSTILFRTQPVPYQWLLQHAETIAAPASALSEAMLEGRRE